MYILNSGSQLKVLMLIHVDLIICHAVYFLEWIFHYPFSIHLETVISLFFSLPFIPSCKCLLVPKVNTFVLFLFVYHILG